VTELLAKQLEKTAGISMTGVTFRGTGPAVQEIAAGRLDFMVGPLAVTIPLHEAKKVKIIGMTSPERLPVAPDVPTLKEQGTDIVNCDVRYPEVVVCISVSNARYTFTTQRERSPRVILQLPAEDFAVEASGRLDIARVEQRREERACRA